MHARLCLRAALLSTTGVVALAIATSTAAQVPQQPVPPEKYTIDARGVDLVSGQLAYTTREVTIGVPGDGGISHGRVYLSAPTGGGWRDTLAGTINASGSIYTVSVGGASEVFVKTGSSYGPISPRGYTLTQSGSNYTFTTPAGGVANFSTNWVAYLSPYQANVAVVTDYAVPSGEKLVYTYQGANVCSRFGDDGQCEQHRAVARLQSVGNNRGYQLHYDYADDDPEMGFGWAQLQTVTGLNLAVEYCAPSADDCALTGTWPSVTYDGYVPTTATDQQSLTTTYGYVTGGLGSVRYPGSSSDDVTISYDISGKVASVDDISGFWTYAYTDVGTTRTTVSAGPGGQATTAVSDQTIQRATSVSNALGDTWSFQYDSQRRLTRITQPEQNYAEFTYGAFGNIEKTTYVDKTGNLANKIEVSATFPSSCPTLRVLCNRPLTTTDANNNVTNYVWDATHGSLLSITSPTPFGSEPRPESRYAYSTLYAWYKNAAGAFVQAPTPVVRLVEIATCATGTTCVGTAAEVKTTASYGSAGTANNLLPTVIATGAGDGSLTTTTTVSYTGTGDVASQDGPFSGTSDLTEYRYDAGRRLVGIIAPDPDGGGILGNRAQRFSYNSRGQVTLTEVGTTAGYSASNWLAFSPLQRVETNYDARGRITRVDTQSSGGTSHRVTQYSYDAGGRGECIATRMNPLAFTTLPTSACSAGTVGFYGPDRISQSAYDAAGRISTITSAAGSASSQTESITYTANGQARTRTDGKGNTSTYEYDDFDRPARLRYPSLTTPGTSSTTDLEQYGYDRAGNVLTYTSRAGQTFTFTYDALNRVRLTEAPGTTPDVAYEYDNLGRPTSISDNLSGGVNIPMTWDALSRLRTSGSALGTMSMQYDLHNRRTQLTWPDAVFVTYEYDNLDQMTAIKQSGSSTLSSYTYNNLGRRTVASLPNGVTTTYAYDAISRLTGLTHDLPGTTSDVAWTYAYNPASQAIWFTQSNDLYSFSGRTSGTVTYTNDRLNRVVSAGGASVTYDSNSNIASDGTRSYGYDAANRLISANGTSTLSYDPVGRLSRMVGTSGASYIYDGPYLAGGAVTGTTLNFRLVQGPWPDEVVASIQGVGTTTTIWTLSDRLMSVAAIVDGAGTPIATNAYDEYGVPRTGNGGRLQYTGQLWLPDFGAYNYKARQYHPGLGRFMQTDPIGYTSGSNLYSYVDGDPINQSDSTGLCPPCIVVGIGFLFGAGVEAAHQWQRDGRISDGWKVFRHGVWGGGAAGLGILAGGPVGAGLSATRLAGLASAGSGVVGGGVSGAAQTYANAHDDYASGVRNAPPTAGEVGLAAALGAGAGGFSGALRGTHGLPRGGTRAGPYHLYPYHADAAHNVVVGELVSNIPTTIFGEVQAAEPDPYIYPGVHQVTGAPYMCTYAPPAALAACRPVEPTPPPITQGDTEDE